jgi:polyphosphate kinase 2 (PPK2 family)
MGNIRLKEIDTRAPKGMDKQETKEKLAAVLQELDELQNLLFAESSRALLVVIQGMDASGKDGTVRNVFGKLNPQGVLVKSFKTPTA